MNSFLEGLKLPLQLKHETGFMHTKNDQIFQNFNLPVLILNSMVTCLQNMFIKPLLPHKLDLPVSIYSISTLIPKCYFNYFLSMEISNSKLFVLHIIFHHHSF